MGEPLFVPPAPARPRIPPDARPSPRFYLWYLRTLARNPLEVFTDGMFEVPVVAGRLLGRHYANVHDPEGIRHVLVTNAENYALQRLRQSVLKPVLGDGLVVAEGPRWKRARRALMPAFLPHHVHGFAAPMVDLARGRAETLRAKAGETISLSEEMGRLTLEILLASLFSRDMAFDADRFLDRVDRLLTAFGSPHPFDVLGFPAFIPRFGRIEGYRLVRETRAQMAELVNARRRTLDMGDAGPPDFLSLLLQAGEGDDAPLSDGEIIDNLLTFLSAGHETTARSLTWTLYLLSKASDWRDRLEGEIDTAPLEETPPARWSEVLPLTTAVLKESMRLYPAAGSIARVALGPDRVAGVEIPRGTDIFIFPWILHRHRRLWRDPDAFDPSRFLDEESQGISRMAYLPFGLGPRVCIGAGFALQEMTIVLATFLSRLRFHHVGETEPMPILRATLHPSTPVPMTLEARH